MKKEFFQSEIGESYVKATLDSGLRIYILPKSQYNSAYAVFGTKYGSIDTAFSLDGETTVVPEGIAHFLEHKLFESEDGDAFTKYAATGAYANAFTSFDRTCYLFSCSTKFYENLQILLDFVQSPYFTKESVQKEQGIIGQEIRMYDDSPEWRVMFNMLLNMYRNHPVRIDIAGTKESIAQIDYDLLYRCYNTFYHPSNMFICIAGNVDTNKVLQQIEAGIKPSDKKEIKRITCDEPKTVVNSYVEQKLAVGMPMFCLGFKEDISGERTNEECIRKGILLEMIAGNASPLYKKLTDEGLIGDEFSFEYFNGRGYATPIFEGESKNPKAVAEAICEEIERIKKNGIDKKLFNAVKSAMYGAAVRMFDSVEGIAMQLISCDISGFGLFDDMSYLKTVTADEVYKSAMEIDTNKSVLSVILPKE